MKIYVIILLVLPLLSTGQNDSIAIMANAKINLEADNPVHSILLYIEKTDNNYIYNKGFGSAGPSHQIVSKDSPFKIASSTKLFVSTIILQLAEEGKLGLNDKAFQYLKNFNYLDFGNFHQFRGKNYADKITIRELLSHRSGLSDIFSDKEQDFFRLLMKYPNKQYAPKSIVELYYQYHLNETPQFKPNNGWHYSDMNYVLLGLIIESIEKQQLHEVIRRRILDRLKMNNTYFEFYEKPLRKRNQVNQYVGNVNFSDLNTSFDWAGGGLVSTNKDLAIFIKALFEYKLINKKSLKKMIDVKYTKEGENRYGLGIYESNYNGKIFYGHYGFYGTYIGYCPETKTILSYCISQATPDFNVYDFICNVLKYEE